MFQLMIILLCLLPPGRQDKTLPGVNSFLGTWHGTSLCVDRNTDTACKDEEVAYDVKGIPSVRDTVEMEAFKIINGQRVSMGVLRLSYSQGSHSWSFELAARVHAVWTFQVTDSTLNGTLAELPSKRLIRRVHANRINE
jgi:hypothetical protein